MKTINLLLFIGAALAMVGACSPGPAPVSRSPRDPSSPSAPEGIAPLTSAPALLSSEGHASSEHEHAEGLDAIADGGPAGVVYVCPMDPEVTSNAPGSCPKCHMKLVPKK